MAAVDFPNSPSLNQVFSSGNIQFQWDGAKWASGLLQGFAPLTNPAGGANNYSPIASPTFTGTPAAPTATVGTNSTQLATTAFVATAISGATTLYAPLTNPTSGTNNYAAIANTVLTGTANVAAVTATGTVTAPQLTANTAMTAPLVNVGTGGVTMNAAGALNLPDTSEWTSAGLTIYAPPSGSTARASVYFGTGGAVPPATIYASLNAAPTNLAIAGGAHTSGTSWIADATTAGAANVGGGGLTFYNVTGQTVGSAISWGNPIVNMTTTQAQFNVPVLNNLTSNLPAYCIGSNTTSGLSIYLGAGGLYQGLYYNGSSYLATATTCEQVVMGSGTISLYCNSGLTVGAVVTGNLVLQLSPTGVTSYVPVNFTSSISATQFLYVQATGSGNANLGFLNNTGSAVGYLYWQASVNTMIWQNVSGTGGYVNIDGNGNVNVGHALYAAGISSVGTLGTSGFQTKAGTTGANTGHYFNFDWTGNVVSWIDNVQIGNIAFTSDYRIKRNINALPSMWERVKALRPISYKHQNYIPPDTPVGEGEAQPRALFTDDDTERWGFIAHELQETLVMDAATGVKDQPDCIQSPNLMTVLAALTKGLQEAMVRIEGLEANVGRG